MDIFLAQNEVLRIEGDLLGISVQCRDGIIWLTQVGDSRDHFLQAGDRLVITCKGPVVLEAHSRAQVGFSGRAPDRTIAKLALQLQGSS
jgi:hypothetical protein